jgi:hypothetical protein
MADANRALSSQTDTYSGQGFDYKVFSGKDGRRAPHYKTRYRFKFWLTLTLCVVRAAAKRPVNRGAQALNNCATEPARPDQAQPDQAQPNQGRASEESRRTINSTMTPGETADGGLEWHRAIGGQSGGVYAAMQAPALDGLHILSRGFVLCQYFAGLQCCGEIIGEADLLHALKERLADSESEKESREESCDSSRLRTA